MTNWAGDGEKAADWWINNLLKGRHRLTYWPPAGIGVLIIITFRGFCDTIAGRRRQKQGKVSEGKLRVEHLLWIRPSVGGFHAYDHFWPSQSSCEMRIITKTFEGWCRRASVSTVCPRSQNQRAVKQGSNHLTPTLVLRKQQKGLSWGTAPLSG